MWSDACGKSLEASLSVSCLIQIDFLLAIERVKATAWNWTWSRDRVGRRSALGAVEERQMSFESVSIQCCQFLLIRESSKSS